ncbi:MAG: addiction module protein [Armatimonadetes bacterium]|nr:addiction module protein [Armatimonadota bacterium]
MTTPAQKVAAEAMDLPVESRIAVADMILASLNPPMAPDTERARAKEAERRVAEIERGEVALEPADAVFERLAKRYDR